MTADGSSRNIGVDNAVISPAHFSSAAKYVYIMIEGWSAGSFSILCRFLDQRSSDSIYNAFEIFNNIQQFFTIAIEDTAGNDLPTTNIIKYKPISDSFTADIEYELYFYIKSFLANFVYFSVWISNTPSFYSSSALEQQTLLFSNLPNTVSQLEISDDDFGDSTQGIHCIKNDTNVNCFGFDAYYVPQMLTLDADDPYLYIMVMVDTTDLYSSEIQFDLEIVAASNLKYNYDSRINQQILSSSKLRQITLSVKYKMHKNYIFVRMYAWIGSGFRAFVLDFNHFSNAYFFNISFFPFFLKE